MLMNVWETTIVMRTRHVLTRLDLITAHVVKKVENTSKEMEHIVKRFVHPIIVDPRKIAYLMEKVDGNVNVSQDTREF